MASLISISVLDKKAEAQKQNELNAMQAKRELCLAYLNQLQRYQPRLIDILDTMYELKKRKLKFKCKFDDLDIQPRLYNLEYRSITLSGFEIKTPGDNAVGYKPYTNEIYGGYGTRYLIEDVAFNKSVITCGCRIGSVKKFLEGNIRCEDIKYTTLLLKLIEQIDAYIDRMEEYFKNL